MNIEMIKNGANHAVDMEKTKYSTPVYEDSRTKISNQGYSLDITGKVRENAAYGKEDLKSMSDIAQMAGTIDVTMQRNYMAVMSNSMSEQDFAKLIKDGVNPTNTRVEESVTSLDKIKIELAKAGTTIEGFNDNLSDAEIEAAAGSNIAASAIESALKAADVSAGEENINDVKEALEIAKDIKPLSEETVSYMVNNRLSTTVENVYRAQYCAGVDTRKMTSSVRYDGLATYAGAADADVYWYEIADQAKQIVDSTDPADPDKAMNEARWLVEHQLPLTKENLIKLDELQSVIFPLEEKDLIKSMASAMADGKSAKEASLIDTRSTYEKAVEFKEAVDNVSEEAVDRTVIKRKSLNIRNILAEQRALDASYGQAKAVNATSSLVGDVKTSDEELISARRLLEETRLAMSCEANLVMLRKGISIDTKPLEELVGELKKAEEAFYRPLLETKPEDTAVIAKVNLYKQTMETAARVRTIPAQTVALTVDSKFTLTALDKVGAAAAANYEKAGKSYETMMTAPRADMGDSIKKAFRNVDDILKDLGIDVNEDNAKTVRILGYSRMQINRENIEKIGEARKTVEDVLNLLSPARTLKLIKEGHNPLNENLYDLRQSLHNSSEEEESESYSRFLLRLDNAGEISANEREAYIGMFRLYRQIEKQDMRAVGNVLSSNSELTLSNLLKAVRTNKHTGMDVSVDDEFGFLENLSRNSSITEQISKGFASLMSPMAAKAEDIRVQQGDKEYTNEKMTEIRQAFDTEEAVTETLEKFDEVTVDNILAMNELMNERGSVFNRLLTPKKTDNPLMEKARGQIIKKAEDIVEKLTDSESAKEAVKELENEVEAVTKQTSQMYQEYTDVKEWKLLHQSIALCSSMARRESYEVPLKTKDGWSSIHLEIVHNSKEAPRVEASFETKELGTVSAVFTQKDKDIEGLIVTNNASAADILREGLKDFRQKIEEGDMVVKDLRFATAKPMLNAAYGQAAENDGVSNKDLYFIAKTFIDSLS